MLASAHELGLLLGGLESAVTVFGGCIDELDVQRLVVRAASTGDQRLSQGDGALLATSDASLQHDPVLVDNTIMRETTDGGDALLGQIVLSGTRSLVTLGSDAKDTSVDVGSVMVTHLTSAGASEAHAGRMPGTDTGHLTQTSVGLTGKLGHSPTRHNTVKSLTLGNGTGVKDLTQREDTGDRDLLFEKLLTKVNLGSDITTVDLHLEKVSDLAAKIQLTDLSVAQSTNNGTVVGDAVQLKLLVLRLLGGTLGVLGEGFLLATVPVLVKATLELIRKMAGPNGGQSAKTSGGLDVTNKTDNNNWGSLQNGDGLNSLLLV
jgi:hypothetical protein